MVADHVRRSEGVSPIPDQEPGAEKPLKLPLVARVPSGDTKRKYVVAYKVRLLKGFESGHFPLPLPSVM
jgi:hypothetical protein